MPIDPNRRALIENEWRPAVQADAAVLALYPEARDIVIDGALDSAAVAGPFSIEMFGLLRAPRKRYSVTIKGVLTYKPSQFQGQPPIVSIKSDRYGIPMGRLGVIVGVQWDYEKDLIALEVWG